MIGLLPLRLRETLRNIDWLARLYRKYVINMPLDGSYDEIVAHQQVMLDKVEGNNDISISLIVPTYNPDLSLFKKMVQSVCNQSHLNWQLVIVDDASHNEPLSAYLSELKSDERIAVVERETNGHISAASNSGLSVATGDYIALLDHDDELHVHALKAMSAAIAKTPTAQVLYSDEDKFNHKGQRVSPHFKPKWNPDLLYSMNYVSHLGLYQRDLVMKVGGFREGYEGSQDYDLLLRCVKLCQASDIIHVPYVLYHWRALRGSTAFAESEKSYSENAGLRALQDHVSSSGANVELGLLPNTYKVNWPLPDSKPLVSIIIPTKNGKALVEQCIQSVYEKNNYAEFEVLLVDNQSDEKESIDYFSLLESQGKIRLLSFSHAFNYSAINNYAVSEARGSIVVLMNNDIEVISENWLSEMVSLVSRDEVGCVGSKLYYPNGKIQHGGVIIGLGGVAGHSHKYFPKNSPGYFKRLKVVQNLSAVTAACLAVRKSVFLEVGGLNEESLTIAFNDVDFCLKVQAKGYYNVWSPYVEMVHHESISRGAEDTPEKQARFTSEVNFMKTSWGDNLLHDPCYSEWLTLDREDFTFR